MGSLMAGWDSPVRDPKSERFRRNSSLTKEEIKAYWRSKKKIEEEHLQAISSSPNSSQESLVEEDGGRHRRSSSLPPPDRQEGFMDMGTQTSLQNKKAWWTSSNWAFLNEPPVIKGH